MGRRKRRLARIGVGIALALACALVGGLAGDSRADATITLGKAAIGSHDSWISSDYKLVTRFSLAGAGSFSTLSAYLHGSGTSGSQAIRVIVYADGGSEPGKLLATSDPVLVAATAAPAWVDFRLQVPLDLQAGDYWLGVHGGTVTGNALTYFVYDDGAKAQAIKWDPYVDGASDPFGSSEERPREMSIYATVTLPPPPPPPPAPVVNTAPPTLLGTAREGETLHAAPGSWSGAEPISFTYQWQRCTGGGSECSSIDGATGDSVVLSRRDVGKTLRVSVTASNSLSTTSAFSALSEVVAPAPALQEATSPVSSGAGGSPAESPQVPAFLTAPWSTYLDFRSKSKGCRKALTRPDRRCTPGAAFSTVTHEDVCSFDLASLVPAVPHTVARAAFQSYGIRAGRRSRFRLDRLVPIELGGSNSIANVWPQSDRSRPGRAAKNKLEGLLRQRVCAGSITLRAAQRLIARDWVGAYRRLQP